MTDSLPVESVRSHGASTTSWDLLRLNSEKRDIEPCEPTFDSEIESSQQAEPDEQTGSVNIGTAMLIVSYITGMRVISPEVLRATSPGLALRGCGRAFRSSQDLFSCSWPTVVIDTFWSHSWHGKRLMKILVLILSYNGPPAVILGTLAAVLMFVLSSFGLLPAYSKELLIREGNTKDYLEMAPWAHGAGCIVSILVLLLWRAPGSIFVDRICIHQRDADLKGKGIISIGGFIKHSRSMVVLWDPSYVERLWCIFELAAFLKSQDEDPGKQLLVRPTFIGPCVLALFFSWAVGGLPTFLLVEINVVALAVCLLCWLIFLAVFGHALRSHQRSIHEMLCQLKEFRIDKTKSQCCALGHKDPVSQSELTCDREILMKCICEWFGTVANFEEEVRSRVRCALLQHLGNAGMPYLWGIAAVCPYLWQQLDAVAARLRAGRERFAAEVAILTLTGWLGVVPIVLPLAFALTKRFQRRRRWLICDLGMTVCITATVVLLIVLLLQLYSWTVTLFQLPLLGATIYAVVLSVAGFFTWTWESRRPTGVTREVTAEHEIIGHIALAPDADSSDFGTWKSGMLGESSTV